MAGIVPFLPTIIGAAGQIFGKGNQGSGQTQQNQLSPQQQQLQNERLQAGRDFVGQPFQQFQGPRTQQFGPGFDQAAQVGGQVDPRVMQALQQGMGGLGIGQDFMQQFLGGQGPGGPQFNQAGIDQFTNPNQQANIDATRAGFGRAAESGLNTVGDQFTAQGAFGGSRQGVAEGTLRGNLARQEEEAVSGIRERGFNDAAQRLQGAQGRFDQFQGQQLGQANQLANLGFGSTEQLQNFLSQAGRFGRDTGQLRQQLGQFGIGQQREKFGERRQNDLQNLAVQQSLAQGLGGQGTQINRTQPAPNDPFAQIGGLATQGIGDFMRNRQLRRQQQQQQQAPATPNVSNNFLSEFDGGLGFGSFGR